MLATYIQYVHIFTCTSLSIIVFVMSQNKGTVLVMYLLAMWI